MQTGNGKEMAHSTVAKRFADVVSHGALFAEQKTGHQRKAVGIHAGSRQIQKSALLYGKGVHHRTPHLACIESIARHAAQRPYSFAAQVERVVETARIASAGRQGHAAFERNPATRHVVRCRAIFARVRGIELYECLAPQRFVRPSRRPAPVDPKRQGKRMLLNLNLLHDARKVRHASVPCTQPVFGVHVVTHAQISACKKRQHRKRKRTPQQRSTILLHNKNTCAEQAQVSVIDEPVVRCQDAESFGKAEGGQRTAHGLSS